MTTMVKLKHEHNAFTCHPHANDPNCNCPAPKAAHACNPYWVPNSCPDELADA